jgi:hypothetical protein
MHVFYVHQRDENLLKISMFPLLGPTTQWAVPPMLRHDYMLSRGVKLFGAPLILLLMLYYYGALLVLIPNKQGRIQEG